MKPIVILQPCDHLPVVISPLRPDSHTKESWASILEILKNACIEEIQNGKCKKGLPNRIVSMVENHPEWECQATEVYAQVKTWCLLE